MEALDEGGFQSIVSFSEAHGRFSAPWSFLMAMKDRGTRTNWFKNEAEVQLDVNARILQTKNGEPALRFFDGGSMMQYQFPSRMVETDWCHSYPNVCKEGHGFRPDLVNYPATMFEVKPSVIANGGRGVFAKELIPKGSVVGLEDCVHGMHAHSTTFEIMEDAYKILGNMSKFWSTVYLGYFDGYGWTGQTYVSLFQSRYVVPWFGYFPAVTHSLLV